MFHLYTCFVLISSTADSRGFHDSPVKGQGAEQVSCHVKEGRGSGGHMAAVMSNIMEKRSPLGDPNMTR